MLRKSWMAVAIACCPWSEAKVGVSRPVGRVLCLGVSDLGGCVRHTGRWTCDRHARHSWDVVPSAWGEHSFIRSLIVWQEVTSACLHVDDKLLQLRSVSPTLTKSSYPFVRSMRLFPTTRPGFASCHHSSF
jgi:hypothetical protein